MTEQEMLDKMVAPAGARPGKPYRGGVIQILVTSSCDKACFACTQSSQLSRPKWFMTANQFEMAVRSLGFNGKAETTPGTEAYFGVVGTFGGNPAMSPHFFEYCEVLRSLVPKEQRGLWCNNPITVEKAKAMRETFDPSVSNINVHLDGEAARKFNEGWPEAHVVGLTSDSRHSPVLVAMRDVVKKPCHCCTPDKIGTEAVGAPMEFCRSDCPDCKGTGDMPDRDKIRELISTCDINQNWSAMIGVFRNELRAWFCEVAGGQAILHQHEPDYPDTGVRIEEHDGKIVCGYQYATYEFDENKKEKPQQWWKWGMDKFKDQVCKHCFDCGVPLRGYGELSQSTTGIEQTSKTHAEVFQPKKPGRPVEVVTDLTQLGIGKLKTTTHYLQNSKV